MLNATSLPRAPNNGSGRPKCFRSCPCLHHQPLLGRPLPTAHSYHTSGPVSDKSKLVAGLLGLLLPVVGLYGVHRLYTGHIALGILMLITCGGCGIWQLIDVILVFAGSVTDAEGRPLRD